MKYLIQLIAFFLLSNTEAFGQFNNDSIKIEKMDGTSFIYKDKYLNSKELLKLMRSNFDAYLEMKKAKTNLTSSYIIACSGVYLIGWQLGKAAFGNDPKWALVGLGAGLVILAIPFRKSYFTYAEKAVHIYNEGKKNQHGQHDIKMNLYLSYDGIGVRLKL